MLGATRADIPSMNVYDVFRVSGALDEVEADFYERTLDAWVFYAGGEEVFRVSIAEVAGITKSRIARTQTAGIDPVPHPNGDDSRSAGRVNPRLADVLSKLL